MLKLRLKILPPITLSNFLEHTKLNLDDIENVLKIKEKFYGNFDIKKEDGEIRTINPSYRKLKLIQRITKDFFVKYIDWPIYMQGGIKGRSIFTNAGFHTKRYMVVNVDVKKCFPNTTYEKIHEAFDAIGFDKKLGMLLSNICTYKNYLPQGAPTSTCVANITLNKIDQRIIRHFKKQNFNYSRFVDDITLSGDKDLRPFKNVLYDAVKLAKYSVSRYSAIDKSRRQIVTGLIVNDKIKPAPEFIKQLKNDIKSGWPENNIIELVAIEYDMTIKELKKNILGRINFVRSINNKLGREIHGLMAKIIWPIDYKVHQDDKNI